MKKLLTTIYAAFFVFTMNAVSADVSGLAIGVSISNNELDTVVTDDIDSNGTINTTKALTDSVTAGSIFAEYTIAGFGPMAVTIGIDYIPMSADLDKRGTTQSSQKAAADGAATSGSNSGQASIEDHITLYIQPGFMIKENTMLYGTFGVMSADVEATWESVSSTNTTKVQSMDGTKIGVGVKHNTDTGVFLKLDYSESDYDKVSYTTSNSTKVTGDIDNQAFGISVGKIF